jgi:hypothetical protein
VKPIGIGRGEGAPTYGARWHGAAQLLEAEHETGVVPGSGGVVGVKSARCSPFSIVPGAALPRAIASCLCPCLEGGGV